MSGSDAKRLARDLRALGVRPDGSLLVHSSMRSLGPLSDGLEGVVIGLLDALEGGALLVPALSFSLVDWLHPSFDARTTASCVGAFAEYVRTRPGTLRSIHLSHSVCGVGQGSRSYLDGHHLDGTPCGPNSPFRRLAEAEGQILMLGCGLRPNTSMHGVEEVARAPYLFSPEPLHYTALGLNGERYELTTRRHGFGNNKQRYDRVWDVLRETDAVRIGPALQATCHLIEAAPMWELCAEKIRNEPWYFVDRSPDE